MFQVACERESQKPVSTSNMKVFQNHEVPQSLPGFRFHPTDEELVRFYLRRKVDKKPMRIDHLIQQIDIYKHDPWDLPKAETGGSNEYYFFCKRGRKYRNSIRPNRVTGSGFWKATGIDKPVYDLREEGNGHGCLIGLKKTLVYYRGCAGKGTKTDWMMHEFRLPVANPASSDKCIPHPEEAAEVWTVCRIFKRNANHKRYSGDWRTLPTKPAPIIERRSSETCSSLESNSNNDGYISFNATPPVLCYPGKTNTGNMVDLTHHHVTEKSVQFHTSNQFASMSQQQAPSTSSSSDIFGDLHDQVERFAYENWDELRSVVAFSMDSSHI